MYGNSWYEKQQAAAAKKIDQWLRRHNDNPNVVRFLVEEELHLTRSPGRREAYQEYINLDSDTAGRQEEYLKSRASIYVQ